MTTDQDLIDHLTATGDYKVIRRLKPVDLYHDDTGVEKQIGLYLDYRILQAFITRITGITDQVMV